MAAPDGPDVAQGDRSGPARAAGEARRRRNPQVKNGQRGSTVLEAEWAQLVDRSPAPDFALEVAEESQILLDRLSDSILRTIAVWKMEGYTTEEIATKLGCVPRTVERKLQVIRKLWGG